MQPLRLPDDTLLIPVDLAAATDGFGLREIDHDHPDYGTWLALAEAGEDASPAPQES
jgi:hypothetical protein